jgi:hypothetical protein
MNKFRLQFLSNEADEDEGLNHAGIATYKDSPYASTARECGQNSSDARINEPVIINFDVKEIIGTDQIEFSKQLLPTVLSCLEKAQGANKEKSREFFKHAKELLEADTLKVLKISDYNTTGLLGPCEPGQAFHSLVKSTGVSVKNNSDTSGGSFGIGKNAVYAISDLQTVFYSTIFKDKNGEEQFLAQGKSILTSHIGKSNDVPYRSTGYWSKSDQSNFKPVDNIDHAPDWLRREEQGTSIFALGFRETENWEYRMVASLIRNFFVAIQRGTIVFNLCDGRISLNSKSLSGWFLDERVKVAAEDSNQLEELKSSHYLYECLTSKKSIIKVLDVTGLGKVSIYILVREDLPKKVSIIRNGMVITDSLEKFGDNLSRFPMSRDFVAFVDILEDKPSKFIKGLENPRHDGLSAEQFLDIKKSRAANEVMKRLIKRIRAAIKEETQRKPVDVDSIDEMSIFFADVDEERGIPDPDAEEDPQKYIIQKAKRLSPKLRSFPTTGEGEEGGAVVRHGDLIESDPNNNNENGVGIGNGQGGKGSKSKRRSVALINCRNIVGQEGLNYRTVWFTPDCNGEIILSVAATGMQSSEEIKIKGASEGKVSEGRVKIDVKVNMRHEISLDFAENYQGPIDMTAFVCETGGDTNEY